MPNSKAFRGTTKQRLDVWNGSRDKTSGGLRKSDLTKNKRGKIVSKKKSGQASAQNNLGTWLRIEGYTLEKGAMLRRKSAPPEGAKKAAPKPKKAVPKPVPKAVPKKAVPKPVPKAVPKKAVPKKAVPKPAPKPPLAPPTIKKPAKAQLVVQQRQERRARAKGKINPMTTQQYDKEVGTNISVDNIVRGRRRRKGDRVSLVVDF